MERERMLLFAVSPLVTVAGGDNNLAAGRAVLIPGTKREPTTVIGVIEIVFVCDPSPVVEREKLHRRKRAGCRLGHEGRPD